MENNTSTPQQFQKSLSALEKVALAVFSVLVGLYLLNFLGFLYLDGTLADIYTPVFLVFLFLFSVLWASICFLLSKKILILLSKNKRIIFYVFIILNVLYVGITYFFHYNPGSPMFFDAKITVQEKLSLGDVLAYSIEPKKGSVIFHDVRVKMVELHKPDGTIETDSNVGREGKLGYYADNFYFRRNCNLVLLTLFCYPKHKITATFMIEVSKNYGYFQNYQFDQAGAYILDIYMGDKKFSTTFNVIEDRTRPPFVNSTNAVIENIPGYTLSSANTLSDDGSLVSQDLPPLNFVFDIRYEDIKDGSIVSVKRMNKSFVERSDCYMCENLQSHRKPLNIAGNNIFAADDPSNTYYNKIVYWISGEAAIVVKLHTSNINNTNILTNKVFKEYLKKYPSTI